MNRSKALVLDPIRLTGNGQQDKSGWTVSTNMSSAQDSVPPATDDDPDAPAPKPASELMVDGKADTEYAAALGGEDPVITLDMGKPTEITSLRYTLGASAEGSAIGDYRIETSLDGENYTPIKEGVLLLDKDGRASPYFDNGKDPWICTYDAPYLYIAAVGQAGGQLSVAELDVFGSSGDGSGGNPGDGSEGSGQNPGENPGEGTSGSNAKPSPEKLLSGANVSPEAPSDSNKALVTTGDGLFPLVAGCVAVALVAGAVVLVVVLRSHRR